MTEGQPNYWLRHVLLIGAFAAGGLTTQLVPSYQEISARYQSTRPVSTAKAAASTPSDVSGTNQLALALVRSIS